MKLSTQDIYLIENHDEAYGIWRQKGVTASTLVHIDAHLDIAWFNENLSSDLIRVDSAQALDNLLKNVKLWNPSPSPYAGKPNIGNYICHAVREGLTLNGFCREDLQEG